VVRAADAAGEPLLVMGGGSNLVVSDDGFDGTVLQVMPGAGTTPLPDRHGAVRLPAGATWDEVVGEVVAAGWVGIEALSGIPGLVGAAPIQNIGAYGQEVAETLVTVQAYDRRSREVVSLPNAECGFGYRASRFKGAERHVVLGVHLHLTRERAGRSVRYAELARRLGVAVGDPAPAAAVRAAVLELRRSKGMVLDPADHDTWSAGSFFTNPLLTEDEAARLLPPDAPRWPEPGGRVKTSAAWLIERSGFGKDYGSGAARVSGKHTLAVTNRGGATTAELLALAREIRDGVRDRFGVTLVNEPALVGCAL
jgi:UDP-N-acetylmuramate dehydrogenase